MWFLFSLKCLLEALVDPHTLLFVDAVMVVTDILLYELNTDDVDFSFVEDRYAFFSTVMYMNLIPICVMIL